MKQTILITGASSGIGKETARLFLKNNFCVVACARSIDRMKDLEQEGCTVIKMDITNEQSIQTAFDEIYKSHPHIDVLVNNAGYSQNGFVEELTMEHLRNQFEVNVFGLIRVTQMVLPNMRKLRRGLIINVGSAGGDFTSAGAAAYHASKYAIESFSDGMRQELSSFGIEVVLIKPGGVETEFLKYADRLYPDPIFGNPYKDMRDRFQQMISTILDARKSSFPILKPIDVANEIFKTVKSKKRKTRVRVGRTAKMLPFVKHVLSDRMFDKMIIRQLGLNP
jgi:short-subunit dehydrogenase